MEPEIIPEAQLRALPTGTITFLFSDIEGSTRRWEQHLHEMKLAVARHDALMRAAIEPHRGYIFKTVGDAFCAAFPTAPDALAAAVTCQRVLQNEDFSSVDDLRVRMALHTGHADERDADYFGPTVNRVARLLSLGHGGQVLASETTRVLLQNELPADMSFLDLGIHRLKDLNEAEHVFQLVATGLATEFAPLNSVDELPNNLPLQITSLRGRDDDVAKLKDLIQGQRLVTLFGAGGVGKTRLALQVGAEMMDLYPDGVWFIEFAPIADPELVPIIVAQVLKIKVAGEKHVTDAITSGLKRKKMLLILDNCEHVVEAAAKLVDPLLHRCPGMHICATSRQALGTTAEIVVRVASLGLPDSTDAVTATGALQYGAVALFVDRATAVNAHFRLTDETAPIVAEICRRLDGIPFAIELAAARVRILSVSNLAHRLNERFKVLVGNRIELPRHQTMRALIDWSYDLLSDQEKTLLRRLSVFAGGYTLDAATAVCAGDGVDALEIFELMVSLVDKSLITADTQSANERFQMLESTRAYGLEKVKAAGELPSLLRRHTEYFLQLALTGDEQWHTVATDPWLESLRLELDNFRAALEWSLVAANDLGAGAALAAHLGYQWVNTSMVEGKHWVEMALKTTVDVIAPSERARLWLALSWLIYGGQARLEASERALSEYSGIGDELGIARAKRSLAMALHYVGKTSEAKQLLEEALVQFSAAQDPKNRAGTLAALGGLVSLLGDGAAARQYWRDSLALYDRLGDNSSKSSPLAWLAESEFAAGNVEEAINLALEVLKLSAPSKDYYMIGVVSTNLAAYFIAQNRLEDAAAAALDAIQRASTVEDKQSVVSSLQHTALLGAMRGDSYSSAKLLGYVDALFACQEYYRETTETWSYKKLVQKLRGQMTQKQLATVMAEGAKLSADDAIALALGQLSTAGAELGS
jgi:predicted ATPase/class 3 adenylate cyclase